MPMLYTNIFVTVDKTCDENYATIHNDVLGLETTVRGGSRGSPDPLKSVGAPKAPPRRPQIR